ncbi:MAG TPA: penicillin-binding protein 2 [Acidobacteriota bacterium]|nr:penicillin-binding protein 2 [Acidobacteriota bacterium]HNT16780.1 penicillin-binding protein 2 [Acidobacteriota bacterium]HPA26417.1 penicillin-binding protein 2 [Acidobacteriota bacterium]HQO19323.1 penicillin-binding protein 2 [Acidobacteriota bacterium]HQQ46496.1 penicillin-binding protein 2 [Acidobacteriota bacterium]
MNPQDARTPKIRFLKVLLLLVLCVFAARLVHMQMIKGEFYRVLGFNNFTRTIILPGRRGMILDRKGVTLCQNRVSFSLLIDTTREGKLEDNIAAARTILSLPLTMEDVRTALRRSPVITLGVIARDIPPSWVEKVEANSDSLPMFRVEMELRREYPYGKILGHSLGYVGLISQKESKEMNIPILDPFQEVGKSGVEKSANPVLMGKNGWRRVQVNSLGREVEDPRLKLPGMEMKEEPTAGKTIHLAIDIELQKILVTAFGEETGSAVFMNPKTGEVLSYVSLPEIDPNIFSKTVKKEEWKALTEDPSKPLMNRPIQGTYPAGSSFKPFIATVGLEEGLLEPGTVLSCGGVWEYGGNPFHCWAKGGHGGVDLLTAIQNSCNIFFYKAGDRIGIEKISKWGSLFAFGGKTGIDLPNERTGTLPSEEWKKKRQLGPWYKGETLPVAIGQGYLTVTPVQILSFYATLANDGVRIRPHLVEGGPEVMMRVPLSQRTVSVVKEGLSRVVESGTGRAAKLDGIKVCAKTGTAQVVKASQGKSTYSLEKEIRDHAWFAGFAPMEDPQVAFVIMVEHGGHGGDICARIAKIGLEFVLQGKKPEEGTVVKIPEPVPAAPEVPAQGEEPGQPQEQEEQSVQQPIDPGGADD